MYLTHLTLRPSNDSPAELYGSILDTSNSASAVLPTSFNSSSYFSVAAANPTAPLQTSLGPQNPESDSFTYIETLLEALAVLGKLVGALDSVIQRAPTEMFVLVEGTIEEVSDRAEFIRVAPINTATTPNSSAFPSTTYVPSTPLLLSSSSRYIFLSPKPSSATSNTVPNMTPAEMLASSLRIASLEASAKESDRETIRDLFWTLYSKLDAVVQGFRVCYEVSNRIGKVTSQLLLFVVSIRFVNASSSPTYFLAAGLQG